MANLVDIFTQSNGSSVDTHIIPTVEDLPKDRPSLFDSLLKSSVENLEINKQQLQDKQTSNQQTQTIPQDDKSQTLFAENAQDTALNGQIENLKLDEELIKSLKTTTNEDNKKSEVKDEVVKNDKVLKSSNSLLDRLLIEVKNGNLLDNSQTLKNSDLPSSSEDVVINSSKIELQNGENQVKSDNLEKIKANLIEYNKDDILTDDKALKSNNSLIDRLLIDIKNSDLVESSEVIDENILINSSKIELQTKEELLKSDSIEELKITENSNFLDSNEDELKNSLLNLQDNQEESKKIVVETSNYLTKNQNLNNTEVIETIQEVIKNSENNTVVAVENSTVTTTFVDDNKIDKLEKEPSVLNVLTNSLILEDEAKIENKSNISLMDRLIKANTKQGIDTILPQQQTLVTESLELAVSKDVASNIFLAEQKNLLNNQMLFNKNEALKILEQGSTLEDIQRSAAILDLEATNLEVEQNLTKDSLQNLKLEDKDILERKNVLNAILNEKNIRSVDVKNLITNSIEASKALLDNTLTIKEDSIVDVQPNLANSIQSRIIGAKQNLSSMMSDIARQMYENYKPPVTVFKINLNPVELGAISILMKQDRANGLSINMSVTSLATLELLMENQNLLRNSLSKTFNDASSFNLDFSSGQDSSNSSNNASDQKNQNRSNTEAVLKLKESSRNLEEEPTEYM